MNTPLPTLLIVTALGFPFGNLSAETVTAQGEALNAWRTDVGNSIVAAGDAALLTMTHAIVGQMRRERSEELRRLSAALPPPAGHPGAIGRSQRLAAE